MSGLIRSRLIHAALWVAVILGSVSPLAGVPSAQATAPQSVAGKATNRDGCPNQGAACAAIARDPAQSAQLSAPSASSDPMAAFRPWSPSIPTAAMHMPLAHSNAFSETLSINDISLAEGNSGTTNAVFTVSLSSATFVSVTVSYQTVNGTAFAPGDYSSRQGYVLFLPFQTVATITVPIVGDTVAESNEYFIVALSNPSFALLGDSQGVATIINDDGQPLIILGSVSVLESSAGTINVTLPISLSVASNSTVSVNYQTADGTATAPADYSARQGTVTFPPGQPITTISIPIVGDTSSENNESFYINLSNPVNATLYNAQATVTLLNDDPLPKLSIGNASVQESASGTAVATFVVQLSVPSGKDVAVQYKTVDGTATAPADYAASQGTLTFAPGISQQTINVHVNADAITEADETFTLQLSSPVNTTLSNSQAVGTIIDSATPRLHQSFMPIMLRPIPILLCNDAEPNNTYTTASQLTSVNQFCNGSLESEPVGERGNDDYWLNLKDGNQLIIDLTDVPIGANYRLTVWYNTPTNNPIVVGESNQAGNGSERVDARIHVTAKYYIRLRKLAAAPIEDTYLLHVIVR